MSSVSCYINNADERAVKLAHGSRLRSKRFIVLHGVAEV